MGQLYLHQIFDHIYVNYSISLIIFISFNGAFKALQITNFTIREAITHYFINSDFISSDFINFLILILFDFFFLKKLNFNYLKKTHFQ